MKNYKNTIWFIALVLVGLFLLYVLTAGLYDSTTSKVLPNELKDSEAEAKAKQKQHDEAIKKQRELLRKQQLDAVAKEKVEIQKELDKIEKQEKGLELKFKRIFLLIRFVFVSSWVVVLIVLFKYKIVTDLQGAITYSELILIIVFVLNFLTFGSVINLERFIKLIRMRVKNYVYRNYSALKFEKKIHQNKLSETESRINELKINS